MTDRRIPTREEFKAHLLANDATTEQAETLVRMQFEGTRGDDSVAASVLADQEYFKLFCQQNEMAA